MPDRLQHQRFTHGMRLLSDRLDTLLAQVRQDPQHVSLDLLDELATTIGELTLVLSEQLAAHRPPALAQQLIAHAETLRRDARATGTSEQIASALSAVCAEVDQLLEAERQAA